MHYIARRATEFVNPLLVFPSSRKIWVVPGSLLIFHFYRQLLMRDTALVARSKNEEKIRLGCSFTYNGFVTLK